MSASLTITPSDEAKHPFILTNSSTSNVTYTITSTNYNTTGVTYNITGDDADKFVVTYATFANDATQQATLTLNDLASSENQILYKINLVATDVADPGITTSKAIGIFVSSSTTAHGLTNTLTAITGAADLGTDGSKTIPELNTTTKAKYPIPQLNANDELQMAVTRISGSTNFNLDVERIGGVNYITLVRITGADASEHVSQKESVTVRLTYTGGGHGNLAADQTTLLSSPVYDSVADMELTVTYAAVQIEFLDAAGGTERESGDSALAAGAVVDYYDGNVGGAHSGCVTFGADASTKSFPIFLNQKCTWTVTGADAAYFTVFSDLGLTTAISTTKAATAYVKFDPGAATDYATKKEYAANIVVTDGAAVGTGSSASRTLPVKVAVSTDATAPIINDISFNGTAFVAIASGTVEFDVNETPGAADHAVFRLDTTKHGTNDPITAAQYYLLADPTAAASGILTSLAVTSKAGSNSATFGLVISDNGANREATLSVDASGITFDDNYDSTDNNVYEFGIFANDSANGGTNSSAVIKITITVKNTTAPTYQGLTGTDGFIVTNGVVSAGGTTNASTVQFGVITSMPVTSTFTGVKAGITLTDSSNASVHTTILTDVTKTTVKHPVKTNIDVTKLVFSVPHTAGMTSGQTYTLTLPDLLAPTTNWQNVDQDLTGSGSLLEGTNASTFVFTYDSLSEDIIFHGPDSVNWARGHPYTEIFYAAKVSGATQNMDPAAASEFGAKHSGLAGNKMSYYNSVDPTAVNGTVGYFTWTVTNAAGGKTSRTRTVTIKDDINGPYVGKAVRKEPILLKDKTHNITFAGAGASANQPTALVYEHATNGIKATGSPLKNAAGDALIVDRTTALQQTDLNTLWAYAIPGNGVPGNATFYEIYQVTNEDVYAYNFGPNNTNVSEKSAEWAVVDATSDGATIGSVTAANTSQSGKSGTGRAAWDTTASYLGDITGKRTVTIVENNNHIISVDLSGLNIDNTITASFSLQAAEDFVATVADFNNHATCNMKMNKADFNNIFFYRPESPGITTSGSGTVWDNLLTSPTLRSETIDLLQKETNWPVMMSGNTSGDAVGSTHQLHQLTASNYKGTSLFESGVPVSGDAIADIVVENWTYDLFGVRGMADIFSSTPTMKGEIESYLTTPVAGQEVNTATFEGAIRNSLAPLNSDVALATRQTGENDEQATIETRPAQFLLYALRDKIQHDSTAHYRLTTAVGGIFNANNQIDNITYTTNVNPTDLVVNATYSGVVTSGGSGSGATFDVVVSGGTITTITVANPGTGYTNADVLIVAHGLIGGSTGSTNATITVGIPVDHQYFPFIWQAGDIITVGTNFKHVPVDAGTLFNSGSSTKLLGDLPFKFVIELV